MGLELRHIILFVVLLVCVGAGIGINSGSAQTDGAYRVNLAVVTQDWFYPGEQVTAQITTFLDKSTPPPPGEPPTPVSPGNWVYMGNVPLRFEVKDKAGILVDLNIPQDLKTDQNGFLEITFNAPEREDEYSITVFAIIEGVKCSDSHLFTVSLTERPPLPTPTPTPTPPLTGPTPMLYPIIGAIIIVVLVAAVSVIMLRKRRP